MKVSLEIAFIKKSYHIETSQLICFVHKMTSFYMVRVFTERYFRKDFIIRQRTYFNVDTQRCGAYLDGDARNML